MLPSDCRRTSALNGRKERFHGREKRLRFHHHALAAPEGTVIDGAMAVMRKAAEIVHVDLDEPVRKRALNDAVGENACKKSGKIVMMSKRMRYVPSFTRLR